jgi:hypothetical protein
MGATAEYYKKNPEARAKKNAYQKKYNAKPENIKSRAKDNKARADLNLPVGSKKDASKKTRIVKGKLITYWVAEDRSKNRGSKSNQPGDKRARGSKQK